MWKKVLKVIMSVFVALFLVGMFSQMVFAASKLTVNKNDISLNKGKTYTISVKYNGKSIKGSKVKWSVNKKNIAAVNKNGKITAKKAGNAVITAKYKKQTIKIKVKVKNVKPSLKEKTLNIMIGKTKKISLKNCPKSAKITYFSSKKSVVTVDKKGKIKGIKAGTATVTVKVKGVITLKCKVIVAKPQISEKSITIEKGKSINLTVNNKPAKAKYKWSSSNKQVANVKNGKVSAIAPGSTVVSVKITVSKKIYYTLNVKIKVTEKNNSIETLGLGTLSVDISGAQVGQREEAIFSLAVNSKNDYAGRDIQLLRNNSLIGIMHDDGRDGDAIAADGVYCLKLVCFSNVEKYDSYKAKCGNSISNGIKIQYFGNLTSDEVEKQNQYIDSFMKIDEANKSIDGGIDSNESINEVYQEALEGVKDGTILSVKKEEDGVTVRFVSGIWYIYQPEQEGIDASGSDAAVSIMTLQPYHSEYDSADKVQSLEATDYAATKVAEEFSNYTFSHNYDDRAVTIDIIKNLSSNEVVLCHTHGYYNGNLGSIIWLGEKVTEAQITGNGKYASDFRAGRLVITNEYRLGFTSGYVTKYCGNLKDSFIYLGSCLSGKDSRLADSFLKKGARAVIANTEIIWRDYNCNMMEDIVKGLLMTEASNRNYYTLEKALSYAKTQNGNNDYEWYPNNNHAPSVPVIFGDKNYRLSEIKRPIEVSSVSLAKSQVVLDIGKTYALTATVYPSNATDKTVTWSSSNTSVATVNNGIITGKSAGTAIITVKTSNGKKAVCTVQVNKAVVPVTEVIINGSGTTSIEVGDTCVLSTTVYPSNATDKSVTWSSSDTNVAIVSSSGSVKGVAAGTCIITAKSANGKTASKTVHVLDSTAITLNAALVYKSNGTYYEICKIGNSDFVSVNNALDLYIKVQLDSELYLDSQFTMYWTQNDSGYAPYSYIAQNSSLTNAPGYYSYYPISKGINYLTGQVKIYFEIIGANGSTIKSANKNYNWNDDTPYAFKINLVK